MHHREARDAPCTAAERHANGQFVGARLALGEQQAGDIGTREEKNEATGREQCKQRYVDPMDSLLVQRNQVRIQVRIGRGILALQQPARRFQLLLSLSERDAVSQTCDHAGIRRTMWFLGKIRTQRRPELHLIGGEQRGGSKLHGEVEALRHDSQYKIVFVIQLHGFADNLGVPVELMTPEIVA